MNQFNQNEQILDVKICAFFEKFHFFHFFENLWKNNSRYVNIIQITITRKVTIQHLKKKGLSSFQHFLY